MKTLAKVAIGMAVAKGVQHVSGGSRRQAGGGLESILGELTKATGGSVGAGGLSDLLGGLAGATGGTQGGLGDLLGGLSGGTSGSAGVLGDLLGGLGGGSSTDGGPDLGGILSTVLAGAGGSAASGQLGGLGGLLDGLAGNSAGRVGTGAGGFGDMLNQSLDSFGKADVQPTSDQEDAARYLLAAMLEAAKADGEIDSSEKKALMDAMADASDADQAFVQEVLSKPIDVDAIIGNLPNDMYEQAYAMSLLAIDLNNEAEAKHLHKMASAMGISQSEVNAIHGQMGEPALYA
ncbi:MAG: DUF533 domain-containing protein [Pseudomonadota bacterium]